jgi:hypothetical protein
MFSCYAVFDTTHSERGYGFFIASMHRNHMSDSDKVMI